MIPKIIHYCWVGNAPKPQSVLYCIESWKKFCPDYEIREWNESNYDFSKNEYMRQAYEAKKWGFVPDYARLDIIYEHGGIYLDTDVEMTKSFDELLMNNAFMGFENTGDGEFFVNCGHGFGAEARNDIIKAARDLYEDVSFLNDDGTYNMLPSPHYTTQSLKEFGLVQENKDQKLRSMMIYASDVLCPKNFRTGKLRVTERTVSIHHFTASWLDEKIRKELEHIQKINNRFGKKMGRVVLIGESVLEKYSLVELFTKLPKRLVKKMKQKIIFFIEIQPYIKGLRQIKKQKPGKEVPVLLDTAMESDNCGDEIIMNCCEKQLQDYLQLKRTKHVPTHRFANEEERNVLKNARYKILCGTNILSGNMRTYGLWKLKADISPYKNTILMGVGFDSESVLYDEYTRKFFDAILAKEKWHSVRDSFSERKLREMGISNVINTGCPTMWSLTPKFCETIPVTKAKNVVCTITDYCRDPERDKKMLEILCDNYEEVHFWIQGRNDFEYLEALGFVEKVKIISSTLEAYDEVVSQDDLDYVGTRLHAGIRALSAGHRSVIVAIDNRARCIARDTRLKIVEREELDNCLEKIIYTDFETKLQLPWDKIEKWKTQFEN